jgi:hypothetical protein
MLRGYWRLVILVTCGLGGLAVVGGCPLAQAKDLSLAPVLDGERYGNLNYWGGPFGTNNMIGITNQSSIVHSGNNAYQVNLGSLPANAGSFFQTFSSQGTSVQEQRQTRDLTLYEGFEAYFRNDTNAPLNIRFELKDYRDSNSHRASKTLTIPTGGTWTKVSSDFNLGSGWSVQGSPDLSRTYIASFVLDPRPTAITGSYYLDDFVLVEPGGPVDPQTAPLNELVERVAKRSFMGLWTSRNRTTGLVYNLKNDVGGAAMNTTGGTLWVLPAAVRRGWVSQAEADSVVSQVVNSLNTNLNLTNYLPTRFINPLTGGLPGGDNEESSIDASFIALALHNYKTQPTTNPVLAAQIDAVQNRFQFDAFERPNGFTYAYLSSSGFTGGTYDGYTNEGKVISLAAEVSDGHHVPLEDHWNADIQRTRAFLVNGSDNHLVHTATQWRAPFEQALINLFVDSSDRGVDNYPTRDLATNPWENFVRFERETAAKLAQLGRENLFQLDAADGDPYSDYRAYSMYNDFGQPELFMPWSAAFALLAGADGAEDALRAMLEVEGVAGPLGLADSVRWVTGQPEPYFVSNGGDNWNTVLMTMALSELLDRMQGVQSGSEFFAALASVSGALDEVFVDGDVTGDGIADGTDLVYWKNGYGSLTGGIVTNGDMDGDGDADGADFLRWQRGYSGGNPLAEAQAVPEPWSAVILFSGGLLLTVFRSRQGRKH